MGPSFPPRLSVLEQLAAGRFPQAADMVGLDAVRRRCRDLYGVRVTGLCWADVRLLRAC